VLQMPAAVTIRGAGGHGLDTPEDVTIERGTKDDAVLVVGPTIRLVCGDWVIRPSETGALGTLTKLADVVCQLADVVCPAPGTGGLAHWM